MLKFIGITYIILASAFVFGADCDVFIHGFTSQSEGYFGDLPRQVHWNSQQEIPDAGPEVARKILDQIETCDLESRVVLRPHSYGVGVVHYILGKGYQFQTAFPDHEFVQVYKKVHEVYAYTGAFQGTAIMDFVCSSLFTESLASIFGKTCVKSLSTSKVDNAIFHVQTPGVVTHLITSSDSTGTYGTSSTLIGKSGVSFLDFALGKRNQNDNTLPLTSTKACSSYNAILKDDIECVKVDSNFIFDFHHTREFHHFEFLNNKEFLLMKEKK